MQFTNTENLFGPLTFASVSMPLLCNKEQHILDIRTVCTCINTSQMCVCTKKNCIIVATVKNPVTMDKFGEFGTCSHCFIWCKGVQCQWDNSMLL